MVRGWSAGEAGVVDHVGDRRKGELGLVVLACDPNVTLGCGRRGGGEWTAAHRRGGGHRVSPGAREVLWTPETHAHLAPMTTTPTQSGLERLLIVGDCCTNR